MARKRFGNQDKISELRNKIEDYNKYQWLMFIPLWVVTVLQMIFPARTIPVPEIYILLLDVAAFLFSFIGFIAIRLKMGKLKSKLAQLEESERYTAQKSKPPGQES